MKHLNKDTEEDVIGGKLNLCVLPHQASRWSHENKHVLPNVSHPTVDDSVDGELVVWSDLEII
jgi:hypothetical protein